MMRARIGKTAGNVGRSLKENFAHATPEFIFIILFVNVFQAVFGQENSIVGVIFAIMMSASMVRDMTATPLKHLLIQAAVLVWIGVAACLVTTLPPLCALPVNLATVFFILYAFTYEYASHMYFPYILSYLFLVFISPMPPAGLPKRVAGLLAGAVCIILYQLFKGRRRVVETARDELTAIIDEAMSAISFRLSGVGALPDPEEVRASLCKLSRTVYERRRKVLCVSDASFSMIDAGRGLEHIVLLLRDLEGVLTPEREQALDVTARRLETYRAFVQRRSAGLDIPERADFPEGAMGEEFYSALDYVGRHLLHMTDPEKRARYRRTALSLKVRLKAALDVSCVRVIYAARTAVLLAGFTLLVQCLRLPHGKWLMFTIASLSLPYADDVGAKTKKRVLATLVGGLCSVAAYALIPSMAGRTAIMMLSGYLSFYFSDYTGTYACSTVGALGGAVFMSAFSWGDVGGVFLVRLCYILAGAAIALAFNCLLCPFTRERATGLLLKKYAATTQLLTRVCAQDEPDVQLYYNLVIQAHLQEDKLAQNARDAGWGELQEVLTRCREQVRRAHRHRPEAYRT